MKKAADFLADNPISILVVLLSGAGAGFFAWSLGGRTLLGAFVLENQLAPDQRSLLLRAVLAGAALALCAWGGLGIAARLSGRAAGPWLGRAAAGAPALLLLACLPVLAIPKIESDHPVFTLLLIALMAAIAFGCAGELAQRVAWRPRVRATARPARYGIVAACALALGYALFMAVLTVARHDTFQTHSFDLGIHDQIVYNALHHGLLRSTQHGVEAINYLGEHFAPFLYLLAPIYALKQDARTLLVLQSLFLGLGAVPVYLLAVRKTRSVPLAVSLAASYVLYPALHGVNTFDFHQIAPVVPLLLFSLYFMETGRDVPFLIFLGLAAMTKEEVSLSVVAIGAYLFFVKRRYGLGAALAAIGLVYFGVVVELVMPAFGRAPQVNRFAGVMAPGSTGFGAIAKTLLTNPIYVARYIFANHEKVIFLVQLLLPVLFLPLLAAPGWLAAVPAISVALLSSAETQYRIGYHYPATIIPFIYFLAALGLARLAPGRAADEAGGRNGAAAAAAGPAAPRRGYSVPALVAAILVASLALDYEYGWLFGKRYDGIPQPTPHEQIIAGLLAQVPRDASVSATSDLVPHVSSRDEVYLFPIVKDAGYLVFDAAPSANFWPYERSTARWDALIEFAPYLLSGQYGVVQLQDQGLLLQRGHDLARNTEALQALFATRYEADALPSDFAAQNLADPAASGRVARVGTPGLAHESGKDALIYGPYDILPIGHYRVHYRLKLEGDPGPGKVARLDVFSAAMGGTLAGKDVSAADFKAAGQYQDFVVELDVNQLLFDVEYRVGYKGKGTLSVDTVQPVPTQVMLPLATFGPNELPAHNSTEAAPAVATDCHAEPAATEGGKTWAAVICGPLNPLPAGKYQMSLSLKVAGQAIPGQAATADLLSGSGQKLAWRDVAGADFTAPGREQRFTADFALDQPQPGAYYRVMLPDPDAVQVERLEVLYIADFGG